MFFAGLWERWEGQPEVVYSCTMVTTRPNEIVRSVGHHRMPVILAGKEEIALWLSEEVVDGFGSEYLFAPMKSGWLKCRPAKV